MPPKGRVRKRPCAESFVNDIWSVCYWLIRSVTGCTGCYRRCICDVAAGYFLDEWEHAPPATTAIAELYRRHAGYKDWDDQCCRPLLFSYRNSIPGSTGDHVTGASAAYENQALNNCLLRSVTGCPRCLVMRTACESERCSLPIIPLFIMFRSRVRICNE